MSPSGGMNEILSIIELYQRIKSGKYQHVILDTPPGKHFLDFLSSTTKIKAFFDQSFIEHISQLFRSQGQAKNIGKRIFDKFVQTGMEKLLYYLNKVTGDTFVEEFIDAVHIIYSMQSQFIDSLKIQEILFSPSKASWYLVTNSEQSKYSEAKSMFLGNAFFSQENTTGIINKSTHLVIAEDLKNPQLSSEEREILTSFESREQKLENLIRKDFNRILRFNEVLTSNIQEQLEELALQWQEIDPTP